MRWVPTDYVFPTSFGNSRQNKDFGLIDSVAGSCITTGDRLLPRMRLIFDIFTTIDSPCRSHSHSRRLKLISALTYSISRGAKAAPTGRGVWRKLGAYHAANIVFGALRRPSVSVA